MNRSINITQPNTMPHLTNMVWGYKDELVSVENGSFTSFYNYDFEGNRTRKVVVKNNIREERYYIGGYEVYRKYVNNNLDLERKTINVYDVKLFDKNNDDNEDKENKGYSIDKNKKFAIVDIKTVENGTTLPNPSAIIRYQYDNHLGSACLELDNTAAIISYEEYHPFGTTSYRSGRNEVDVSLKRYKYIGKERDEETGLYYFGARYYAGWIGRWISVDPLKEKYLNLTPYNYCANGPLKNIDLDGKDIYITDPNTNKSYLYVPGETAINAAKDSFVETVAKTLDELTSSGKDKFDIVSTLVGDENINANIKLGSWDDRGNTVSTELNGKIYGTIPWSPEGGVITKEGGRQSPATVLLHELGHYYFDAYDPTGELAKDKFIDIEKKKLESMVHLLTDG